MYKQQYTDHFIGRVEEIDTFGRWLADPSAPWILYIHDASEESDKKGGVGKTWLLRRCAELTRERRQDIAIAMIDFFNVEDRDCIFLAEKIITRLQELYSAWHAISFTQIMQQYRPKEGQSASASGSTDSSELRIRELVSAALAEDLRGLDTHLAQEQKTLLVFFDTFEVIEQNPVVAVLRQSQTFPDNYQFEHMRVVIAGRNRLDWAHPNWRGREQEAQSMALASFDQQEMMEYFASESIYDIAPQSKQAHALYERTEGRPIIIGLAIDVLNYRVLTLDNLIAVPKAEFEGYLVPQVNKLENPLNWVILFMAHVYHRFNISILEWILRSVPLSEPVRLINREELSGVLPQLSFIRRASSGDDFVLHDEMRRLVTRYCWEIQDTDRRFRKDISQSIIIYYKQKLAQEVVHVLSEQQQRGYIIETLYHRLFVDLNDGLDYFQEHFQNATRLWKSAFARLLLQEVQQFADLLSSAQHNDLLLAEAKVLRIEQNGAVALQVLQQLKRMPDEHWRIEHQADLLMEEGLSCLGQSKFPEADSSFTQCLAIEEAQGNELHCAYLFNNLALVSRHRGQFDTALDRYQKSIVLFKKLGKQLDYANSLANMSFVYRLQGKIEEALRRSKIAWRIRLDLFHKGEGSELQVGLSLSILGTIYLNAGNITESEQYFSQAFDIYLRVNYRSGIPGIYNKFGQIRLLKGELDKAREWFEKAEQASRDINVEQHINSLNKQGNVCVLQYQWEKAVTFFEQAIAQAQQVPDYYQQTESLIDLADALQHLEQQERVQQILQEAQDIATKENYFKLLGRVEQMRGEVCYSSKDYATAFRHFALFCHYMALYNVSELNIAIRKVTDALLDVARSDVPSIVQELLAYWREHQLDEDYPELIEAFQEVDDLIGL